MAAITNLQGKPRDPELLEQLSYDPLGILEPTFHYTHDMKDTEVELSRIDREQKWLMEHYKTKGGLVSSKEARKIEEKVSVITAPTIDAETLIKEYEEKKLKTDKEYLKELQLREKYLKEIQEMMTLKK
jgi:hypothetical protein